MLGMPPMWRMSALVSQENPSGLANTSCDADHASEEFYDAPEEVDCGKKYEDFSGRPVDRNIRVTRQSRDHRIVCRAEVQVSTDRLTASVRDLGNSTLPIKQN